MKRKLAFEKDINDAVLESGKLDEPIGVKWAYEGPSGSYTASPWHITSRIREQLLKLDDAVWGGVG